MRRRVKCIACGHIVMRVIGAKCFLAPCPKRGFVRDRWSKCGGNVKPVDQYQGGRPLHKDGPRERTSTMITTPALVHFMRLASADNKPLSRYLGDLLEAEYERTKKTVFR